MDKAETILDLKEQGLTWAQIAERLGEKGQKGVERVRSTARRSKRYKEMQGKNEEKKSRYFADGSISSSINIRRECKQLFTPEELIELHGFNSKEFQLKSVTSNEWTTPTNGETYYNYQSKIIVAPIIKKEIGIEEIKEFFSDIKPKKIELSCDELPKDYLLIPLADMHFGLNNDKDYEVLRREIADKILNQYEEILFTMHGDYFHVDNFLNTTEKGTRIDDVDFKAGVKAGYNFLLPLLELALENSPNVKVVYLKGNHAPSIDYMFISGLERMYPQIEFDTSLNEFKHAWLGMHSIFMHHGDKVKNPNKLVEIMVSHFGKEWGESQSRYLITGHFHHEKSLSFAGLTWYQLQSPSKHSSYDKMYGYNTTESGQMLFEFTETKRSAIYYI